MDVRHGAEMLRITQYNAVHYNRDVPAERSMGERSIKTKLSYTFYVVYLSNKIQAQEAQKRQAISTAPAREYSETRRARGPNDRRDGKFKEGSGTSGGRLWMRQRSTAARTQWLRYGVVGKGRIRNRNQGPELVRVLHGALMGWTSPSQAWGSCLAAGLSVRFVRSFLRPAEKSAQAWQAWQGAWVLGAAGALLRCLIIVETVHSMLSSSTDLTHKHLWSENNNPARQLYLHCTSV